MSGGHRLTGCAVSDHPDPAVAVGEVVGHLENTLAGSPQFALLLADESIGMKLSTFAGAVHHLLGPDLLVAVAAPQVAGSDHPAPSPGSLVVWALCGIDVSMTDETEPHDDAVGPSKRPAGRPGSSSLTMRAGPDGAIAVGFATGPDGPAPLAIGGDGASRRGYSIGLRFPPGSASLVRSRSGRRLGPPMTVTDARGRTLVKLDHVAVRAVLLDRLETTDPFVDGPSMEFPPLRVAISPPGAGRDRRLIDVVAVDPNDGSAELDGPVTVGERVQVLVDDPEDAGRRLTERLLPAAPRLQRALLVDGHLPATTEAFEPIATAAIRSTPDESGLGTVRTPWSDLSALLIEVSDED